MSTTTQAPALDMNKLNAFIGQFVTDLGAAVHTGMVVIGEKLGLYKALAAGPMSSAQLAASDAEPTSGICASGWRRKLPEVTSPTTLRAASSA